MSSPTPGRRARARAKGKARPLPAGGTDEASSSAAGQSQEGELREQLASMQRQMGEMMSAMTAMQGGTAHPGHTAGEGQRGSRAVPFVPTGRGTQSGSEGLAALRSELGEPQRPIQRAPAGAEDPGERSEESHIRAVAKEVATQLRGGRRSGARHRSDSDSSNSSASSRRSRSTGGAEMRAAQRRAHGRHPMRRYRHVMGKMREVVRKTGSDSNVAHKYMRTQVALGRYAAAARMCQMINNIHQYAEQGDMDGILWQVATIYMFLEQYSIDNGSLQMAWLHTTHARFDEAQWSREPPRTGAHDIEARMARLVEPATIGGESKYIKEINTTRKLAAELTAAEKKDEPKK